MENFIRMSAWTGSPMPSPSKPDEERTPSATESTKRLGSRPFGHFRSLSSISRSSTPSRPGRVPGKSPSTSQLPHIPMPSSLTSSPALRPSSTILSPDQDTELSTLPDPRSRAMSPVNDDGASVAEAQNMDDEITTLSTKLINAINHQTVLDNTLSGTRQELEQAREVIRNLEATIESQREKLSGHLWVRRQDFEDEKQELLQQAENEKKARIEAEVQKKKIEGELESLTMSLFQEANTMVSSAKAEALKQQEALEKKNEHVRARLADAEALLLSQQQQLAELKLVMEQMTVDRDDQTNLTAPSSPGLSKFDSRDDDRPLSETQFVAPLGEPVSPAYPTSFSNLIQPVLRTDLASYEDFQLLAKVGRNRAGSRVSSGPFVGSSVVAVGGAVSSAHPSNTSSASLAVTGSPAASLPHTPQTPPSVFGSPTSATRADSLSLKDTTFYKRVLVEDIEPTLRLDSAQGLKWLGRRSVLNAMVDGNIVVEPAPKASQRSPCALCGESRLDDDHIRTHVFRTSESDSAQRHPLCAYCLARVRSTCDFLNFLRILKDGYWKTEDADSEKAAWEESVRLREQMFWARIGGGVIPAAHGIGVDSDKSPRRSHEHAAVDHQKPDLPEVKTEVPTSDAETEGIQVRPVTPPRSVRHSTQSLDASIQDSPEKEKAKRLSITIPATHS